MPAPPPRPEPGSRPDLLLVVCGTGTEVGKTWVAAAVLRECRRRGLRVVARKPAQSYEPDPPEPAPRLPTDAEVLAAASGEDPSRVCPPHRSYTVALAPPMAAEALGREPFTVDDLVAELGWPSEPVALGLVELAGGVASPQAADGDGIELVRRIAPDVVVLVADAGLGTLNAVRLTLAALSGRDDEDAFGRAPVLVVLNRFDAALDVHRRNRAWLAERDHRAVFVTPGQEADLLDALLRVPASSASTTITGPAGRRSEP